MKPQLQPIKEALVDAGIEIYRASDTEIQIAERVRLHIMDSGVRLQVGLPIRVLFTARSQKSDFPNEAPEHLFGRVRQAIGDTAGRRGYVEASADTVEVKDPVDQSRILDVWHEVTYEKVIEESDDAIDEVRWALAVEKYVTG